MLNDLGKDLRAYAGQPSVADLAELQESVVTIERNMKRIEEHGQRAEGIIRAMLLHANDGPSSTLNPVEFNPLIESCVELAVVGLPMAKGAEPLVSEHYDPEVGLVEAIPADIRRVVINLVSNAGHALAARAANVEPDYRPVIRIETRRADDHVELIVRDNGIGIPRANLAKVYDPFFTTKEAGKGIGLGLFMSHSVIRAHRGEISVRSELGEFTEFTIRFPLAAGTAETEGSRAEPR